ncbi:hypothetical protein O181_013292 [Austropuccinia psidii MF-1]|uniref:Uncharacterized protein n=1 Tax=Austropuccinia psidii MF-1 TaxID=1389203 RepID=A0A9Q3GNT3_9BASI|nr:hypothetical protein [Austropuccinia psidii MF-1]
MNLGGIGAHTTSLVALSEFTPIILASGEETRIHFFIQKGSVHTVLGRPFLADKNIRLEFSHKKRETLSYKEPDGRILCMPICKPQALGWKTGPPRLQNTKWQNNLKRKPEESISEYELPNIFYKPIDNNEETFQILVDVNEKTNGNPFKTKYKRKKARFSEHHELSDEEIINEIEKDLKMMEEREKNLQETYHIKFLDRPLNSQEPYEWKLENPKFIQQPPNEDEERESDLKNEYNYL